MSDSHRDASRANDGDAQRKVVHDIRNSLNAALMSAELAMVLAERGGGDEQLRSALRDVISQCRRCGELLAAERAPRAPDA